MNDIPIPTLGFDQLATGFFTPPWQSITNHNLRSAPPPSQNHAVVSSDQKSPRTSALQVSWAKHLDEVREAQRLRYEVFAGEMGARLRCPLKEHDIDRFDDFCEHLLVREPEYGQVVGTYRLLTPVQAGRAGGLYTDTEFYIPALQAQRKHVVELGRSCVHPHYRSGAVILALWTALMRFMQLNQLHTMVGCASVPLCHAGYAQGMAAASIWLKLEPLQDCVTTEWRARAYCPLTIHEQAKDVQIEPPALIKAYLRMGAKVLGAPALDVEFNTADLPMMMHMNDLPPRYRKHFLEQSYAQ